MSYKCLPLSVLLSNLSEPGLILKNLRILALPMFRINVHFSLYRHTHAHTLLNFVHDYPVEPTPERYNQEGKTNLDSLEQEVTSSSGISWAICKNAP